MEVKYDSNLFYTCSLIEYIGRVKKRRRQEVADLLGNKKGNFDNEKDCRYLIPDYWTIGEVYERLIEDCYPDKPTEGIWEVYHSWISDNISDYNTDFYYQPRDYIAACYVQGDVL